jgi:hypothetical protein
LANWYVHSGAVGSASGADWANAKTTMAAALAASAAAGDTFYVAHDHAETQASALTLAFKGTNPSPDTVLCVNRSGSVPPVSADLRTTATITTTGANAFSQSGVVYLYGIVINAGSGATNVGISINASAVFDNCALNKLGTTGINTAINFGSSSANEELRNTTVRFGSTSDGLTASGALAWRNTASAVNTSGSIPTTLFAAAPNNLLCEAVDLSAITGTLFATAGPTDATLKDCKLGASVTICATPTPLAAAVVLIRCDSGDTNYRTERYRYQGTLRTETTIVRTGGASDGTTPIAWKLTTTANSKRYLPFESLPISIWNETTGSAITLTVEGIWGGGAVPTNADIWMDVEYLGTSGFPLGSFATSGPADQLAAGTNLSAGSGTWGGSTTKFKLEKTITPQEKGPITVYVKAALASSIFYLDPKLTVS